PLQYCTPRRPPPPTLSPYTTLFRSNRFAQPGIDDDPHHGRRRPVQEKTRDRDPARVAARPALLLRRLRPARPLRPAAARRLPPQDRKSTRLNSSHVKISYAVFCLKN